MHERGKAANRLEDRVGGGKNSELAVHLCWKQAGPKPARTFTHTYITRHIRTHNPSAPSSAGVEMPELFLELLIDEAFEPTRELERDEFDRYAERRTSR